MRIKYVLSYVKLICNYTLTAKYANALCNKNLFYELYKAKCVYKID